MSDVVLLELLKRAACCPKFDSQMDVFVTIEMKPCAHFAQARPGFARGGLRGGLSAHPHQGRQAIQARPGIEVAHTVRAERMAYVVFAN